MQTKNDPRRCPNYAALQDALREVSELWRDVATASTLDGPRTATRLEAIADNIGRAVIEHAARIDRADAVAALPAGYHVIEPLPADVDAQAKADALYDDYAARWPLVDDPRR